MESFKMMLMFIILSISIMITRADSSEDENLSTYLKTIDKLISNAMTQKNGPSFDEITATSIKKVKSMLVKLIDSPSSPSNQRLLMLEAIKDLQKVEDYLATKEPIIREIEDYIEDIISKNIFAKDRKTVYDVNDVLEYIEELNTPETIEKNKLRGEIDSIVECLTVEARHNPEIEKLVDYLEVRRSVIDGVMDMDRYMEKSGLNIKDMHELRNITQEFAPFVDRLLEHKGAVKQMNSVFSSLVGKNFIDNAEDAKKMSLMMKLEMFSSMQKVQRNPTKWSKLIEELKHLTNL